MDSVKAEPGLKESSHSDLQMADPRPSYKSWKKKYRKMRITFDERMRTSEEMHQLEMKAMRTAKRLAIENDRLMDLLLDINESPQIPTERRIDVSLESERKNEKSDDGEKPLKTLQKLLQEVPHRSYDATVDQLPEIRDDLDPKDPNVYPTSFLTATDVDEYLSELDKHLGLPSKPTVPPPTKGPDGSSPAANFALNNPTSVYNWLRKHAPKTFLQDLEKEKEKEKHKEKGRDRDRDRDRDDYDQEEDVGAAKKKRTSTVRTKRQSGVKKEKEKDKGKERAESGDLEDEVMNYTKPPTSAKGKRKRDEDPGYRPKSGVSRPTKKRKSAGGASSK